MNKTMFFVLLVVLSVLVTGIYPAMAKPPLPEDVVIVPPETGIAAARFSGFWEGRWIRNYETKQYPEGEIRVAVERVTEKEMDIVYSRGAWEQIKENYQRIKGGTVERIEISGKTYILATFKLNKEMKLTLRMENGASTIYAEFINEKNQKSSVFAILSREK